MILNVKTKTQELTQSSMKMGEAMYKDQQTAGASGDAKGISNQNQILTQIILKKTT